MGSKVGLWEATKGLDLEPGVGRLSPLEQPETISLRGPRSLSSLLDPWALRHLKS